MGLALHIHNHSWLTMVSREHFTFLTPEKLLETAEEVARNLWEFMNIPDDFTGLQQFEANTNEQLHHCQVSQWLPFVYDGRHYYNNNWVFYFQHYNQTFSEISI